MNALLADFKSRWGALPQRTQTLAIVGAVVVVLALLYLATWRPLQKDLVRLRASVPLEAGRLSWMRAQAPVAKSMRARAATSTSALAPAVEQSAATHGVRKFVTEINAEGNNSVRVTLDAIPFTSLLNWISELQASQGAVVDDATIEAHETPGLVNARLRLRAGIT